VSDPAVLPEGYAEFRAAQQAAAAERRRAERRHLVRSLIGIAIVIAGLVGYMFWLGTPEDEPTQYIEPDGPIEDGCNGGWLAC
jgi:ferric-dicitrate binding protein FerR (iron transport regulator)